jgi:microcystin-dependent protein
MKAPRITSGALGQPSQWNALHDDAQGSAALLAHQMLGYFSLGTIPTNGETLTFDINGTNVVLTGVTSIGSTAGNFLIVAGNVPATLLNAWNLLQNPWTTNANQVALSLANQELLAYIGVAVSGTTLTVYSLNTSLNSQLTSFSGSTTFASGSYNAQTMQLYVEPAVFYIGATQVKFAGGSTPTVTAPVSHPRIDLLTINTSGVLAWTTGTENASPVPPSYPFGVVPICELWNVVGETLLLDNANQNSSQGFISTDVRPFNNVIFINNNNQIGFGVSLLFQPGMVMMWSTSTAPTGWLICDGSAVSRTTYATLFGVIGTTFGIGNGSTTFNLPDMRGRVPIGVGTGTGGGASGNGTPTGGNALTARTLADWAGEETHTLSTGEMPAHSHNYDRADQAGGGSPANSTGGPTGSIASTDSQGGGSAHNNIQPMLALEFIIHT